MRTISAPASSRSIEHAFTLLREALAPYVFKVRVEDDLQAQVFSVLKANDQLRARREVIASSGRFDVLVECDLATVVLELKLHASAAAVERQAQRYALTDGIDAVAVVTTSSRLARGLDLGATLGGKPFTVITARTF